MLLNSNFCVYLWHMSCNEIIYYAALSPKWLTAAKMTNSQCFGFDIRRFPRNHKSCYAWPRERLTESMPLNILQPISRNFSFVIDRINLAFEKHDTYSEYKFRIRFFKISPKSVPNVAKARQRAEGIYSGHICQWVQTNMRLGYGEWSSWNRRRFVRTVVWRSRCCRTACIGPRKKLPANVHLVLPRRRLPWKRWFNYD